MIFHRDESANNSTASSSSSKEIYLEMIFFFLLWNPEIWINQNQVESLLFSKADKLYELVPNSNFVFTYPTMAELREAR